MMWKIGKLYNLFIQSIWSSKKIRTFAMNAFFLEIFYTLAFRALSSVLDSIPKARLSWNIHMIKSHWPEFVEKEGKNITEKYRYFR